MSAIRRSAARDSALIQAARKGSEEGVRAALANGARPNAFEGNMSALGFSALLGARGCIDALLEAGACVSFGEPRVLDPLSLAIQHGQPACARLLMSAGADVNAVDRDGGATPLLRAVLNGQHELARELIERGADVEARLDHTSGALMLCATQKDEPMARLLLAAGANPNYTLADGFTPLMMACAQGDSGMGQLLLDGGADPLLVSSSGHSALQIAREGGGAEMERLLMGWDCAQEAKSLSAEIESAAAVRPPLRM